MIPNSDVLDAALASRFAEVALENVMREYPNKLDHVMASDADVARPAVLHPVFYGSYDWHSSVHMHWTLVTLLRRFPGLPASPAIVACLERHFTDERIAAELAYLARPASASFERPYGWAWLLKLVEALHLLAGSNELAVAWRDRMQPLATAFVRRIDEFLPRAVHPSRAGSHANSAFATLLMLDYASTVRDAPLAASLSMKALAWYGADRNYPVSYETCSEDFLSNGLLEAVLMRRILSDDVNERGRFHRWWEAFVPDLACVSPWLVPVVPSDRSDARLSHIDGLNLSRAWCWTQLVGDLPAALRTPVRLAIRAHLRESLPHAAAGHYVGTHWLASFALLALGV